MNTTVLSGGEASRFPTRIGHTLALVLDALLHAAHPLTAAEIRSITGLPKSSVAPTLINLAERDVVIRSGHPQETFIGRSGEPMPVPCYELQGEVATRWAREAFRAYGLRPASRRVVSLVSG